MEVPQTSKEQEILEHASDHAKRLIPSSQEPGRLTLMSILEATAHKIGFKLPFEVKDLQKGSVADPQVDYDYICSHPQIFDRLYENLVPSEHRKRYGQFITPLPIARFMVRWASLKGLSSALDPAVGPGIFLEEVLRESEGTEVYGIDIDALALNTCALRLKLVSPDAEPHLLLEDFLTLNLWGKKFDFIVCNPPYLNFHDFDRASIHRLEKRLGLRLSKLTNIYSLFFMRSIEFLSPGARIAFITPGEFLYTGYGQELKLFLLTHFTLEALILIDFSKMAFRDALTTSVVTLLKWDKPEANHKVKFVRLFTWPDDKTLMDILDGRTLGREGVRVALIPQSELNPKEKWLVHFGDNGVAALLKKLVPLSEIATVNRGIATGANNFFTLNMDEIRSWGLEEEFLVPCLTRAFHAPHYDYTLEDFERSQEMKEKVFLLYCFSKPSKNLENFLASGQKIGVPNRYIPEHRKPWYSSEKQEPATIIATVFSREKMRFIHNEANVRTLTTFHCIYPRFNDSPTIKAFLAYLNSNLCREIQTFMRREYGGGLHKFEPRDLEELPVLDVLSLTAEERTKLATLFDKLRIASREAANDTEIRALLDEELKRILDSIQ